MDEFVRAEDEAMRRLAKVVVGAIYLTALAEASWGAIMPRHPSEVAVAAGKSVVIGNSVRLLTVAGQPAPLATSGQVLLDERSRVGDVCASKVVRTRLLAQVLGDVTVPDGTAQLGPQTHVTGDVVTRTGAIVGLDSLVDGDVVAAAGPVKVARLSRVRGNVFAKTEFRADTDVTVGATGTTLEIVGPGYVRDRSEYFSTILHEGTLDFLGVGEPVLHAPVTQMGRGTLVAPSMPAFRLARPDLPLADPGSDVLVASRGGAPLVVAPGVHGKLTIGQDATVVLSAGTYVFDAIESGSTAKMVVNLGPAPAALDLIVRRDAQLGRRFQLVVHGAERTDAATRVVLRAGGSIRLDMDGVFTGTMQATKAVVLGKAVQLVGALWSAGDVQVGRDSMVTWVTAPGAW